MSEKPTYEELEQRIRELEKAVSERRHSEEALRESEQKFRSIIRNLPMGIHMYQLGPDGQLRFVGANPAADEILGVDNSQYLSKTIDEAFPEIHKTEITEKFRIIAEKGGFWKKEDIVYKDEKIDGAFENYNFQTSLGNMASLFWDITERKQEEAALREREERFRSLYESAPDMFVSVDAKTANILNCNRTLANALGYKKEEIIGRPIFDMYSPDSAEYAKTNVFPIFAKTGTIEGEELQLQRKDGSKIDVSLNVSPVFDENGNILYSRSIWRDITKQKHAEDLLRKAHDSLEERVEERTFELVAANDQLQQELNRREAAEEALAEQNRIMTVLLDNLQVGVFMVEASSGKPLLANRSAIELLGRGIINGSYKDNYAEIFKTYKLGTNEYYPVEQMPIYLGLKGRSHTVDDMVVVHPDGNKVFLEVFGSPVLDQQGKVIASLVSFSDITGRKRAEQGRERLQVQIQQAQKMESIGTLAGGIAHNFNNLLMGIQGRTSLMMLETDRFHPSFEHLQEIEICIQKAAKLTKQLLGFARGGKYEIKPTALNDLVENSAQMFGRTKKEITIFKKYEENLWPAAVDQSQIDQVLLNIFVNAWQAMPEGGDLYIQTKNEILDDNFVRAYGVAPGKYIKISIMDTGIGMDEKTMKRVFDPFFTTKEKGRGTGFGLASAYGIIKNHDGIITVESAKDEGATFHVYLPASEKTIIEKEGYEQKISVGSETILLVDDEAMIIDVSVQMLNKMGYKVLTAHNGREAIDIFKQNYDKVGIVILDMIMPGMGGGEVYERLKEIDTNVKVLLSSGYSINGQAAEILNRGCDGFIQKPFKLNELSYKLREIISKQKVKG